MSPRPRTDADTARPELMAADELQEIITRACTGKDRYTTPVAARRDAFAAPARSGGHVNAYRCPFGDGTRANAHWHIGHVPSVASLERLAMAVRQHAQGAA